MLELRHLRFLSAFCLWSTFVSGLWVLFCAHPALGKKTLGKTPQFSRHEIKSQELTKAFVSLWLE